MKRVPRLNANLILSLPNRGYATFISNPAQLEKIHCHSYYEIFLVCQGSCTHIINSSSEELITGDLCFMRPDDIHCYINTTANFKIINILIPMEIFDSLSSYLGEDFRNKLIHCANPPHHRFGMKELKSILSDLEQLVLLKKLLKDKSDMFFRITLFNLLTKSFALLPQNSTGNTPEWLRWLTLEMMKKENFSEGLPALYRLSDKSKEHLSRACQKYLKKSPSKLINDIRLEYAVDQLMNTEEKIVTICEDSGFDSLSHFYHIFKKSHGISPKVFRQTMKAEYPTQFTSEYVYEANLPDALPFDLLNT